jgi:hypothetical protein
VIKRIEMEGDYSVIIENNQEKKETQLGVDGFSLMFTSKQSVVDHISLLNKALEFWEYE